MSNLAIPMAFQVARGRQNDFLAHVRKNAATSVANDPDCHRFDVLTPGAGLGTEVVLCEVYDSSRGFEAHQQTQQFADFPHATEAIVRSSAVEHSLVEESDHVTSRTVRRTVVSNLLKTA